MTIQNNTVSFTQMKDGTKEEYELLLKGVHPDVILLIVDSKPDKRLSATKFLLKEASVKEFPTLSRAKLLQWMKSFFLQHGSDVDPKALETLIGIVGEDQMQISKELEKLALFAADRKCTKEDVEILALPTSEQVEWRLMELLGRGEVKEALSYVQHLLERGENPYALWNRLLWMVASLVLVSSAVQEGNRNPGEVSKVTGLNFGTVRTLFPIAQQVSQEKLSQIVSFMADSDRALKTGGYRSTVEAPQELCAVIDRCMLKLGALK